MHLYVYTSFFNVRVGRRQAGMGGGVVVGFPASSNTWPCYRLPERQVPHVSPA